jgi:hypothetical protein
MDRVFVRTCSAGQASVLSAAAGRCARIRSAQVRIHDPAGRHPIDPLSNARYLARIEVLDAEPSSGETSEAQVEVVVSDLFGRYLD